MTRLIQSLSIALCLLVLFLAGKGVWTLAADANGELGTVLSGLGWCALSCIFGIGLVDVYLPKGRVR